MDQDTTYVALDDSKRKIVAGILRPGEAQPELREMPKEPHLIRRLFQRLRLTTCRNLVGYSMSLLTRATRPGASVRLADPGPHVASRPD